jgi:hypothetical protein
MGDIEKPIETDMMEDIAAPNITTAKAHGSDENVAGLANLSDDELKLRERKLMRKLDLRMISTLLIVRTDFERDPDSC